MNLASSEATTAEGQPVNPEIAAVRVEIQRYMGYETTPMRYLSLAYDATMNINEQVALLEIGFLVLMFLPLVVLLGFKNNPLPRFLVILSSILLLTIASSNSYLLNDKQEKIKTDSKNLEEFLANTSFEQDPFGYLTASGYKLAGPVGESLERMLSQFVKNDQDTITYPILLSLVALFSLLAFSRVRNQHPAIQGLCLFSFIYTFFWLLLSAGIVWYGFLALPLLWLCIVRFFATSTEGKKDMDRHLSRYAFYAMTFVFIAMGLGQRFTGIKMGLAMEDPMIGKRMFDPAHLKYICGDMDEKKVIEAFYPDLTRALDEINRDRSALIYNVGTRFNFFIAENDRRIFKDNQLDYFNQMVKKFPTKQEFTAALSNAGVKFVMVDYYTPSADKTPEQSLVERYKNFMYLFYENPQVELLATDRLVKLNVNGQQQIVKGVFGDAHQFGHYAIFKIK
ncbi:MAG: hypothetical protein RI973_1292 [Bacteroidota bacterium]